jgi:hypothetical protein
MKKTIALALSAAAICSVMFASGCGRNRPAGNSSDGRPSGTASQTDNGSIMPDGSDGNTDPDGSGQPENSTAPPTQADEDPATVKPKGFEDVTFGGRIFTIAAAEGTDPRWESAKEIYSDESDAISIAARERNVLLQTLYDCKIELLASPDPAGLAIAEVTANKHTIDIFSATGFAKSLSESGNIYNLYNLGIDFSHEWWDPTFVSAYTVKTASGADTLYALMGDFCLSSFAATHAIIYNKDVLTTSGITDDPETLAKNHEWTMDKFTEMIRIAAKDASGNSSLSFSDGDILGWARTGHASHGLHTASAESIIKTENGAFSFAPSRDPAAWTNVIERAIGVWQTYGAETLGYTKVQTALVSDKTLFASEVIDVLERIKDADVSVGVLPYPLYSPLQERYAHYVDNHVFTYHVPVSVIETETVGQFLEVFGYHSRHTVRKAFINVYGYEYCGDPDSAEMLTLILDSRTYDPGYHYWSNAEGELSQMISSGTNNAVKWSERKKVPIENDISSYINRISEKE